MRSLYTDDIPGAHPRIRHYEKKLYRFEYSPAKEQPYYTAVPYPTGLTQMPSQIYQQETVASLHKPLPRHESLQLHRRPMDLSQSEMINWEKVRLDSGQSRLRSEQKQQRSRLSQIARTSVLETNTEKLMSQPYFPHYFNGPKDHNANKFTGNRYWNPESHTEVVFIPRYKKVPEQL